MSCLSYFKPRWDGLNRIERPTSYNVARNANRNAQVDLRSFVPVFGAKKLMFKHSAHPELNEYWCGLKPDGTEYILGLVGFIKEADARASYIQKLAYWGRRPTEREDSEHIALVVKPESGQDLFDVRLPVSIASPVRSDGFELTLGNVLGLTDL